MTLLLNLINRKGIHQSSDYRLKDLTTRRKIDDELGSKQVQHDTPGWTAQISFTGIASLGRKKTRYWIVETLTKIPESASAHDAMHALASAADTQLRSVPLKDRVLTIVATVRERTKSAISFFVISRTDLPGKRPSGSSPERFAAVEVPIDRPREFIFGYKESVSKADRKLLARLNTSALEDSEIRSKLALINARSAKSSRGFVSEGCLVSSTLSDGTSASENFGRVPGVGLGPLGSPQVLEVLRKTSKGKPPVMVQSRGVWAENAKQVTTRSMNVTAGSTLIVVAPGGQGLRLVTDSNGNTFRSSSTLQIPPFDMQKEWGKMIEGLESGPSHKIGFSSTSGLYRFLGPDRSVFGDMAVGGIESVIEVVKNRVVETSIASVEVRPSTTFNHSATVMTTNWDINSELKVAGINVHGWGYTCDMLLDQQGGTVGVRFNSVAFRSSESAQFPWPEGEELVLFSSLDPIKIHLSKASGIVSGEIKGFFFLRDISGANQIATQKNAIRNLK